MFLAGIEFFFGLVAGLLLLIVGLKLALMAKRGWSTRIRRAAYLIVAVGAFVGVALIVGLVAGLHLTLLAFRTIAGLCFGVGILVGLWFVLRAVFPGTWEYLHYIRREHQEIAEAESERAEYLGHSGQ